MRLSPLGLDGWSVPDMRAMPPTLMQWLVELLSLVEHRGRLARVLVWGYMALVPKDGLLGALNTRPLTVVSAV